MKAPAFQFYADDFLSGTITMTDAEVGLYIRLLCHQWNSGGLPNDNAEIELHSRGGTPLKRVLAKFQVGDDGLLRNARLEGVRAQQDSHREKQSKRGTAGAEARWNNAQAMLKHPLSIAQASPKHPSSIAQAMLRDGSPTPTPTPTITPKKNNTHPQSGEDLAAEAIYQVYPRKVAKADAIKAIKKAMKDSPVTDLLEITKLYAASQTPGSPYTPYPASWFTGKRYEDDPAAWTASNDAPPAIPAWKRIKDLEEDERKLSSRLKECWDREKDPAGVAELTTLRKEIAAMKGQQP